MKAYQLRANRHDGEETVPALSREEAEFFSIYKGEPGNFAWVADFSDPDVAYQHASKWQAEYRGQYRLDTRQFDAVMNPKPETTGHPHAELMAQYAEDAKTHREPWALWEYQTSTSDSWNPASCHLEWHTRFKYRRKPAPAAPAGDPTHCPFCGGTDIAFTKRLHGSEYSQGEVIYLDEYQCRSESCGRSFWS